MLSRVDAPHERAFTILLLFLCLVFRLVGLGFGGCLRSYDYRLLLWRGVLYISTRLYSQNDRYLLRKEARGFASPPRNGFAFFVDEPNITVCARTRLHSCSRSSRSSARPSSVGLESSRHSIADALPLALLVDGRNRKLCVCLAVSKRKRALICPSAVSDQTRKRKYLGCLCSHLSIPPGCSKQYRR
jgi:hypothetical protein